MSGQKQEFWLDENVMTNIRRLGEALGLTRAGGANLSAVVRRAVESLDAQVTTIDQRRAAVMTARAEGRSAKEYVVAAMLFENGDRERARAALGLRADEWSEIIRNERGLGAELGRRWPA